MAEAESEDNRDKLSDNRDREREKMIEVEKLR